MDAVARDTPGASTLPDRLARLRSAFADLLDQEFAASTGHVATVLNGCAFAPSLLTFWFVNGVIDFSTAVAIGAVASPGGLAVRLVAYVLLVPVFLGLRVGYYLVYPVHRRTILSGACPQSRLLSLDWFSVGILATGLLLALRNLGPWIGMNATFLVGLFALPRFARRESTATAVKLAGIAAGTLLFLYANYGDALVRVVPLPPPASVLDPVATYTLSDGTTAALLAVTNSLLTGPIAIAGFAVAMNYVLTRDELASIPLVRHALPRRDPWRIVTASAALGTAFFLAVAAGYTGQLALIP